MSDLTFPITTNKLIAAVYETEGGGVDKEQIYTGSRPIENLAHLKNYVARITRRRASEGKGTRLLNMIHNRSKERFQLDDLA